LCFFSLFTDKYGNPNEKTLKRINVSKTTKIGELKSLLTRLFDVDITTIRIWNYESPSSATLLDDINSTLAEEQIIYGQKLLVEKQLKDGTWPRSVKNAKVKKKETSKNLMNGVDKDKENINSVSIVQKGCCGLVNLGTISLSLSHTTASYLHSLFLTLHLFFSPSIY
jgi:hypothetical protein